MKKFAILVLALVTYTNSFSQDLKNYTGTFSGLTEDYYFQFKDNNMKITVFNEIENEVTVDLFDEDAIGKKFEITWKEITIELTDENGEATGETQAGKQIISMTEIPIKKE